MKSALGFSLALLLALARFLQAAEDNGTLIDSLQNRLATVRADVERLLSTQADVYDQLDRIETELELSGRLLRELRKQSAQVTADIQQLRRQLDTLRSVNTKDTELYNQHLHRYYLSRAPAGPILPFASNESMQYVCASNVGIAIAREQQRLGALGLQIVGHEQTLASLKASQQQLDDLVKRRQREEEQARQAMRQRDRLVAQLQGERRQRLKELSQIESAAGLVEEIVAQFENERLRTNDAVWQQERQLNLRLKGRMEWPARGKVVETFGAKFDRGSGLSSRSNGIDITVGRGAKVVAALTGSVLYIGWARGLERFVVVDHGGSVYSVYGNIDRLLVSEGDQLVRGEQFANTAGTRLHFEVRDGKDAVDPLTWLRK